MKGIISPLPVKLECDLCGAKFILKPYGSLGCDLPLFWIQIPAVKVRLRKLHRLLKSFIVLPPRSDRSLRCPYCEEGKLEYSGFSYKSYEKTIEDMEDRKC